MVAFIKQEKWTKLVHMTSIGIDEIKDFHTVRSDGTFEAKPMSVHLRMFKCLLLYYKRKCREYSTTLSEDDVEDITQAEFEYYCGSERYSINLASGGVVQKR
jgi:hypothetical protein